MTQRSPTDRIVPWGIVLAAAGLLVWSVRSVWLDPLHTFWGQSIDTVHSVWVLWWVHQDPSISWVDYPEGTRGAVLPPLAVAGFGALGQLSTPVFAHTLLCICGILFSMAALGLLTHHITRSTPAAALSSLLFVAARPGITQAALGTPEAVSVGWLCLAMWAGLVWCRPQSASRFPVAARHPWAWSGLVGGIFAVSVIENPYSLVPAGVAAIGLACVRVRQTGGLRAAILAAAVGGGVVGARLVAIGGSPGGTLPPNARLAWRGLEWQMYDLLAPSAAHLLWPWPLPDLTDTAEAIGSANAHHFVGWTLLVLAGISVGRRSTPWLLAGLVGIVLAMGSAPLGNPGPPGLFLLLNQLLAAIIAPVTQPERFLVFAVLSFAVAAGLGALRVTRLLHAQPRAQAAVWLALASLVVVEALTIGGPATDVPTFSTRPLACFSALPEGPVFTLEDPSLPGEYASAGMLLQTLHNQPGTHHGVGGWSVVGAESSMVRLREDLMRTLHHGQTSRPFRDMLRDLRCEGVRWVVLPTSYAQWPFPDPDLACGGWAAIDLSSGLGGPCRELSAPHGKPMPRHGKVPL